MSEVVAPPSKRSVYTVSIVVALAVLVAWCVRSLPGQIAQIMHRLAELPPPPADFGAKTVANGHRGEIAGEAIGGNLFKGLIVYGLLMLWLIPIKRKKVRRPWLMALLFVAVAFGVGCAAGPIAESRLQAKAPAVAH